MILGSGIVAGSLVMDAGIYILNIKIIRFCTLMEITTTEYLYDRRIQSLEEEITQLKKGTAPSRSKAYHGNHNVFTRFCKELFQQLIDNKKL